MSDPRNAAHNKKVKHDHEHQPHGPSEVPAAPPETAPTPVTPEAAQVDLEKSVAVLSKLKEMEFHSRANIETLAGLTLTIADELKQKEFSDPMGELYSAQAGFETKIAALIELYSAKCESLKQAA